MTMEKNRLKFQCLAEDHKDWFSMDDPTMSLANIFRLLCFNFANEEIIIELPDNTCDIQGSEDIDPNDATRVKIDRDGKNIIYYYLHIII